MSCKIPIVIYSDLSYMSSHTMQQICYCEYKLRTFRYVFAYRTLCFITLGYFVIIYIFEISGCIGYQTCNFLIINFNAKHKTQLWLVILQKSVRTVTQSFKDDSGLLPRMLCTSGMTGSTDGSQCKCCAVFYWPCYTHRKLQ